MSDDLVILFPPDNESLLGPFARISSRDKWLRTSREVAEVFCQRTARRCLTFDSVELVRTVGRLGRPRRHKLVLLEKLDEEDPGCRARIRVLRSLFAEVIRPEPSLNFLRPDELAAALTAPNAGELAIAVSHDPATESIYVTRGDLESLVLPDSALNTYGDGPEPDLERLRVEDSGQTIRAGEYEASMDALLYEYDRAYRRKIVNRRRAQEQSLGASMRRLRLQKGLRQSDFLGISTKEIARIERGEVKAPRAATLRSIADQLGVAVGELDRY